MISASAALAGWYLMEGRFTTAPALDSLSRAEAEQVATKVGLSIDFSEAYSETVARGMVISTNPGPGYQDLGARQHDRGCAVTGPRTVSDARGRRPDAVRG